MTETGRTIHTPAELEEALESARELQKELDRRVLQLKTLHEATTGFTGPCTVETLLNDFLLRAMGAVGVARGFFLLFSGVGARQKVVCRGLSKSEAERLMERQAELAQRHGPSEPGQPDFSGNSGSARLTIRNEPSPHSAFPEGIVHTLAWTTPKGGAGLMGLGAKLTGDSFDERDAEFLSGLVNTLAQALDQVHSAGDLEILGQDLEETNQALGRALNTARQSREELDRRLFHLQSLYDATLELGPLKEPEELAGRFILLLSGIFGAGGVFLALAEPAGSGVLTVRRGQGSSRAGPTEDRVRAMIFDCMRGAAFDQLRPGSVHILDRASLPGPEELDFTPGMGALFRLDDQAMGVVILGEKIMGGGHDPDEAELLATLTGNFLVSLSNGRSFATIQALNRDLNQRNIELKQTLDDLTSAHSRIEFLERARAGIRALLKRQAERVGKVSPSDFVWMLLLSLILGLVFNMANPGGVEIIPPVWKHPPAPSVTAVEARELTGLQGANASILVDARPESLFARGHLPGAVNMPPDLFDFIYGMRFGEMDLNRGIIVYGRTISRLYDEEVADLLKGQGHEDVRVLVGGCDAWEREGFSLNED